MNIFHYDSKDNAIKFEQTPDIYYSLLLNSEYVSQKGIAFKDVYPLSFETNETNENMKENMMKENVYYIKSILKRTNGIDHSKLTNMELNMDSSVINKHFKGFD